MPRTYKLDLSPCTTSTDYNVDWSAFLPDNTAFLVYVSANSESVQFNTALPNPMVYSDFLNAQQHITNNATIGANPGQLLCCPTARYMGGGSTENFYVSEYNRVPLYISSRPTNNNFNVKILQSTTNNVFTVTSGNIKFSFSILFEEYKPVMYKSIRSKATPFSVVVNSANGLQINTKSFIQYNYQWSNHYNVDPSQEYIMTFSLQTMGMGIGNTDSEITVETDLMNSSSSYICSNTWGNQISQQLGTLTSPTITTMTPMGGSTMTNNPVRTLMPVSNTFNVRLYDYRTTTLFAPLGGPMEDYILLLQFLPLER